MPEMNFDDFANRYNGTLFKVPVKAALLGRDVAGKVSDYKIDFIASKSAPELMFIDLSKGGDVTEPVSRTAVKEINVLLGRDAASLAGEYKTGNADLSDTLKKFPNSIIVPVADMDEFIQKHPDIGQAKNKNRVPDNLESILSGKILLSYGGDSGGVAQTLATASVENASLPNVSGGRGRIATV